MSWWKHAVKELNITPSEAWALDYVELATLAEVKGKSQQDTSFMVNAIRMGNGCPRDKLKNLIGAE